MALASLSPNGTRSPHLSSTTGVIPWIVAPSAAASSRDPPRIKAPFTADVESWIVAPSAAASSRDPPQTKAPSTAYVESWIVASTT